MIVSKLDKPSFVYLIRAGKFFKIGKADRVKLRISSIQTSNPSRVVLIDKFKCDNSKEAKKLEKRLHKKFKNRKISGEWFTFTDEELREVKLLGKAQSGKATLCPACSREVQVKGRYIFKNGTQHLGAYCEKCRKFFYIKHSHFMNINNIPIIKSNLEQERRVL